MGVRRPGSGLGSSWLAGKGRDTDISQDLAHLRACQRTALFPPEVLCQKPPALMWEGVTEGNAWPSKVETWLMFFFCMVPQSLECTCVY